MTTKDPSSFYDMNVGAQLKKIRGHHLRRTRMLAVRACTRTIGLAPSSFNGTHPIEVAAFTQAFVSILQIDGRCYWSCYVDGAQSSAPYVNGSAAASLTLPQSCEVHNKHEAEQNMWTKHTSRSQV